MIRQINMDKPKEGRLMRTARVTFNILLIAVVSILSLETFLVTVNFQDFMFMVRRKDIMSAARKVEEEEQKLIQQKIKEIRKESLKKILTPVVINEAK